MQDLAQVTVYALYIWLVASVLWMWRSVLRSRRARKLESDAPETGPDGAGSEQDEMMSAISVKDDKLDHRSKTPSISSAGSRDMSASTNSATLTDSSSPDLGTPRSGEPATRSPKAETPSVSAKQGSSEPVLTTVTRAAEAEQAPGATPTSASRPTPSQPGTIADHLSGIRLPYDLLPMLPNGEKATDQRVSLVSDGAQPEVVGVAIADELERLGYSIKTLATDEAVATRGQQTLGLQIYPDASNLSNDAGSRFPDAVIGSVAIDLWVKD